MVARAQVAARVSVETTCPSPEDTQRALRGILTPDEAGEWALVVSGLDAEVEVSLTGPQRAPSLVRRLELAPCADLASAISVIVHAHLLDLRLVEPIPAIEEEVIEEEQPATEVAEEEPPLEASAPALEPERPAPGWQAEVALAASGGVGLEPLLAMGEGGVEVGFLSPGADVELRLGAGARGYEPQSQGTLTLVEPVATLGAAIRVARFDPGWLAIALQAGVLVDVASRAPFTAVRARLLVTPGLELGVVLGGPFWVRFDARLDVMPFADEFRIDPLGAVGASPFLGVRGGIAIGIAP